MAPNINNPGGVKNDPDEIRDAVVSDATKFPGGFIDQQITEAGADVVTARQFQLSTSVFLDDFDVNDQDGLPQGLAFDDTGSQMYVVGKRSETIYQYDLSTSFDVTTATLATTLDVKAQDNDPEGMVFNTTGSRLFVVGRGKANVYQYDLSTDFDITTATFQLSFDVSSQEGRPRGLAFDNTGGRLYVTGTNVQDIHQYNLSTSFDVSTATLDSSFDVSPQDTSPRGLTYDNDGTRLFLIGQDNRNVYQYELSTAFDISTAVFNQTLDVSPQDLEPEGLTLSNTGARLYVIGQRNDKVYQYALGELVGAPK